jgi:predicted ATP-grasp superfamily ATP-dependent carboligase
MHVLLYEHITSGGFAEKLWEPSFAAQAFAMMNTMVHALNSANHNVHMLYDKRINTKLLPEVEELVEVSKANEWKDALFIECKNVEQAIIIAPEDDMILADAIKIAENSGVQIAGPNSESASFSSDKASCISLFENLNFKTPQSITGSLLTICNNATNHPFPSILKETISSGATSLIYLQSYDDLSLLLEQSDLNASQYILQEYVDGTDASVSLIITENEIRVLTLNKQYIHKGLYKNPAKYLGGECPLDHPADEAAKIAATQIAESIPGLKGNIGIDFILQGNIAMPIEVNPRLTVSSIGISRVISPKILASVIDDKMIEDSGHLEINGYAVFAEYTGLHTQLRKNYTKNIRTIPGVVSPPVQLEDSTQIVPPYLCGWGTSIIAAKNELLTIQKKVATELSGDSR